MKTVNAHVQDVAVAVHQLDGFLLDAADVNFLQSTKLANSVVDVGHKVTHLKRIQFLEGQGLGLLVLVANREALVAFKQVVVHVGDDPGFGVLPAAVQGSVDPVDGQLVSVQVVKNRLESVALRRLATHYPQGALRLTVRVEGLHQELKILGECGLGQGLPRGRIARLAVHRHAALTQLALPLAAAQVQLMRFQAAHDAVKAHKCLFGQSVHAVQLLKCDLGPLHPNKGLGAGVGGQRFAAFRASLVFDVRNQGHALHPLQGELVDHVKRADAFYLGTKKLQPVRLRMGKRKHVDDSAPNRKLTGLFDKIDPLKVQFKKIFVQEIHVEAGAHGDLHAPGVKLAAGDDFFGQGLGVGDYGHGLGSAQPIQYLGAQADVGVVGLVAVGVGAAVRVRKKQHRPRRQKLFEVVEKIRGLFFVAAHHDKRMLELGQRKRGDDRGQRARSARKALRLPRGGGGPSAQKIRYAWVVAVKA